MRSFVLMGVSLALTASVIANAYYQKQQFYPSVVYITKSNSSMAVMYIQALVFVVLVGKFLRALFFGQLRAAEMEHLIERSWYAVTETCLAFTVFRDDFSPRFVALFTLLLFLKCFHWLAEDRIDYMERSPAISWLFHIRAIFLMLALGLLDIMFVKHAFESTMTKGPSVQLVFGFEYEILFTVVLMTFIKYVLHTIDLRSQNPWDNKAVYLLYSELVMGLIRVMLYVAFVFIMIKVHTFPLFAIRPMYLTIRAFQKAAQDVVLSRRAIRNMNTLYPDATPEELSSGDNVCIICREEMTSGCKKLPCNHIFHTSCLRSWFQRQQSCPTCRLEVLRMPRQTTLPAGQQQPPQPQQPQPEQNQNPFQNFQGMFGGFPFQWPPNVGGQAAVPPFMWQQQQQQQQAAGQTPTTTQSQNQTTVTSTPSTTSATETSTTMGGSTLPPFPPFVNPMFPSMPPFMPPMPPMFMPFGFPPPPISTAGLSEEELRLVEGVERSNIEARIEWLRDIQALLDGAMVLINQYNTVVSHIGLSGINTSRIPQSSRPANSAAPASDYAEGGTPSSRWWPEGSGARPKYTSTMSTTETTDSSKERKSSYSTSLDSETDKVVEGATGVTVPKVESIPEWDSSRDEEPADDMNEVRKRRLERFSQSNALSLSTNASPSSTSSNKEQQNNGLDDSLHNKGQKH